ncbi:MAG: LysR family transcriptional regulator [Pseudomonadota bacterium]
MLPDPKDPSYLGALIYFHHAAKALSFSKASDALNVTPSAVSHRISALEAALEKRLFERGVRSIQLTQDGIELARSMEAVWDELQRITSQVTRRHVLRVSIGPYLSSQWLLPRLGRFESRHPDLRIDLIHQIGEPNANLADVAIVWTNAGKDGASGDPLFDTKTIPVTAKGLALEAPFWTGRLPPIHYRDRSIWREWLLAANLPTSFADRGEVLDDPNFVLEAASHGRGIAMGFLPFINAFIDAGRLEVVDPRAFHSTWEYRLTVHSTENPSSRRFAQWILEQAEMTGGPAPVMRPGAD